MTTHYEYFAKVPLQMERLLAEELRELGASDVERAVSGVAFEGPLEIGYRSVLWTRLATAVLLQIDEFSAATPEELYEGVRSVDWKEHMSVDDTLKVTFTSLDSAVYHNRFGAQKVKDGVVDQFREQVGERPSVQRRNPDLHINCHVEEDRATLSIDLAGSSLHRRSYRVDSGGAPIKEHVAAAVLLRAGWPEMAREGRPLFDPMCGSGTLLIEGALMAADHAPGLLRDYFGVFGWRQHDEQLWRELIEEARARAADGMSRLPGLYGSDIDGGVLNSARQNTEAAGLEDYIDYQQAAVRDIKPPAGRAWPGLLVTNAPYGERLGSDKEAEELHRQLGDVLRERFPGWNASVLTGSEELGRKLGLSADKTYMLYNGRIKCRLVNARIFDR